MKISDGTNSWRVCFLCNGAEGRIGYFLNERGFSAECSLRGISSNSFLWKRINWSVVIQTLSGRGKRARSARGGRWQAHAEQWHCIFHTATHTATHTALILGAAVAVSRILWAHFSRQNLPTLGAAPVGSTISGCKVTSLGSPMGSTRIIKRAHKRLSPRNSRVNTATDSRDSRRALANEL